MKKPSDRALRNLFMNTNLGIIFYLVILLILDSINIIELSIFLFVSLLVLQIICVIIGLHYSDKVYRQSMREYTQKVVDFTYKTVLEDLKKRIENSEDSNGNR